MRLRFFFTDTREDEDRQLTEIQNIRARLVAQETKRTTNMDLTDTSMTFAVEGFRFLLSRAMTGEKKRDPQDELVIAFCGISRAQYHSPVRRKVAIRVCSIRVCTNILSKTSVYSETVMILRHLRHGLRLRNYKENLSKHLLVQHIATLGPRPQPFDVCEVRFLNRVIRWVVPPFGKAPERIENEADPRHSEQANRNSGLQTNSKGVNTPGERTRDSSHTIKLSPQDSTSYRSNVIRLALFVS